MNTNLINHIVRNNISKPTMISRTTHAVMNMGKQSVQTPMVSTAMEDGENVGPIRHFKTLEKKQKADEAAALSELKNQAKLAVQEKLAANNKKESEKQEATTTNTTTETEAKHQTARPPPQHASSKLLQAVMALSDKSVNNLKYMSKKGADLGLPQNIKQQTKLKNFRRNGSVLSGSSSRYHRRYKHRLHSHMFHNTIHAFSTQSYNKVSSIDEPPRNQQMNSSWAIKSIDVDKAAINKALMPVDNSVRNLISVCNAGNNHPDKETDRMYNWNHPPSPDDFEIDLARIIDTVPHRREVQNGRLRLLRKHSSWENNEQAIQNLDATETFARYSRGGKSFLPTDDPNCILDKPLHKDLTASTELKTQDEIEAHLSKCENIEAVRRARKYGPPPNTLPNVKTLPWPLTQKRDDLLRSPKWEPGSRYMHSYNMTTKEKE